MTLISIFFGLIRLNSTLIELIETLWPLDQLLLNFSYLQIKRKKDRANFRSIQFDVTFDQQ